MAHQPYPYAWPNNDQTYLFIDGGYVQKRFIDGVRKWFGEDTDKAQIDFNALIQNYPAGRRFYYYCLDEERREGEDEKDQQDRIAKQKAHLSRVSEARGCHIRLGVLKGQGKEKRQKKVDVLLAVDMLTHAANKNMTKALLLAGDLDFQPAIESLVQLGIFVELIADDKHTAPELAWAASSYTKLTFNHYYSWSDRTLKEKYHLPDTSNNGRLILKETKAVKTGSLDGKAITLYATEGKFYLCPTIVGDEAPIYFVHDDPERLELYLKLQGRNVVWN